jgi:hypothetical protein
MPTIDEELNQIERDIRTLKIEYISAAGVRAPLRTRSGEWNRFCGVITNVRAS